MSDLDTEFAVRFTIWSSTLATAIVVGHWAYHHREWRMPCLGVMLKAIGWSVHQFYWMQSWIAFQSMKLAQKAGDAALAMRFKGQYDAIADYRWITVLSEALIIIATVFVLSVYLRARVGRWWPVAGFAVVGALLIAGFAIGFPR